MFAEVRKRVKKAGQPPGTPIYTGDKVATQSVITVVTYNGNECHETVGTNISECLPEKLPAGVTWVNIEGLQNVKAIDDLANRFNLHPLTIEDILNVEQRPKVEEFDGYIFITLKALHWDAKTSTFTVNQTSLVFGKDFVLSFQEHDTTLFDMIRTRLQSSSNQRLRQQGSDYLIYRLIDAIVDQYFVVLEALGDQIEIVEETIITAPTPQNARTIYKLKRQMLQLRKAVWPMREALSHLMHGEDNFITQFTRIYMRDVYDHTVQAIDTLETFRDMLSSMLDMYLSSLTNHMNEIMKTLTIITTIFIPITAIASIFGMNFEEIPGLKWRYGYPVSIVSMLMIAIIMIMYFRKKNWL